MSRMFNLNELAQVEDILQRSPSLTAYEVQMAICELRDQGSCYVRDQGQIEYAMAYLPFVKVENGQNGNLRLGHW